MSFEDRVRSTVDQAIGSLVQQLVDARPPRNATRPSAPRVASALEEAEQAAQVRVADAEARVRATIDRGDPDGPSPRIATSSRARFARRSKPSSSRKCTRRWRSPKRGCASRSPRRGEGRRRLKAAVAAARVKEREIEMAGVTRLLESVRGLDGATSLSEVLDALALARRRAKRRGPRWWCCAASGFRAGGCPGLVPATRSRSRSTCRSASRA